MLLTLLKSKLHRATVTAADLEYEGSVGIAADLLELAGILPHERVEIYDITNGARLATYAIALPAGSSHPNQWRGGALGERGGLGHHLRVCPDG